MTSPTPLPVARPHASHNTEPAIHAVFMNGCMLAALHSPQLIDAEVASGVRGLLLGRKVERVRADEMLHDFAALRIRRHPMLPHQRRVIELRNNLTAYDAFYMVLAESLQMPLLTGDAKVAGHAASVQVYPSTPP